MPRSESQRLATKRAEKELRAKLALAFHDAAQRPWCSICHEPATEPLDAHHWVEHGVLRREFRNLVDALRLEAIAFDVRNVGGTCRRCHGGHHGPSVRSRITRDLIPESAWEFAREMDALARQLDPSGGTERFTVRLEGYSTSPEGIASESPAARNREAPKDSGIAPDAPSGEAIWGEAA